MAGQEEREAEPGAAGLRVQCWGPCHPDACCFSGRLIAKQIFGKMKKEKTHTLSSL